MRMGAEHWPRGTVTSYPAAFGIERGGCRYVHNGLYRKFGHAGAGRADDHPARLWGEAMRLLIFGGTTEGRVLAARAAECGAACTVSVATPLGAEELSDIPGLHILVGRKDADEIAALCAGFDLCVDATHPYAVEATANIRAGCAAAGIPLKRLLRAESRTEGAVFVPDCAAAARLLSEKEGNILLTTGAKELPAFAGLARERLFARVLPTHAGIDACEALGLPHSHIIAMQGPFSQQMNEAMLRQYHIAWLVTKDGGAPGGFAEKQAAAQSAGAALVLIGRPPETGETMEEILALFPSMPLS